MITKNDSILNKWFVILGILFVCLSFSTNIYINVLASAVILVEAVIRKRLPRIDHGDFLVLFGIFLWKYYSGTSLASSLAYGVGFTLIYEAGKEISRFYDNEGFAVDEMTVMAIASFHFVRGLIHYSFFLGEDLGEDAFELWPDITGIVIPRTQHEFFLVMIASLLGFFVLTLSGSIAKGIAGILISLSAIALGVYSNGRMTFFCAAGACGIVMFAYLIENKLYRKKLFRILFAGTGLIVACLAGLFASNTYGLYDIYHNSMWAGSGGIVHNTRFTLMADTIRMMKDYPFGGNNELLVEYDNTTTLYAHNSWLDIGKQSGIIPMILTMGFTISNCFSMVIVWVKNSDIKKYAVIAAFTGITLYNMFEPAILANPLYWTIEVFLGGILRGMYIKTTMEDITK